MKNDGLWGLSGRGYVNRMLSASVVSVGFGSLTCIRRKVRKVLDLIG